MLLGMLHGLTPDEHTWPITFSYSIGSYSSRGGMKAGLMFSGGFTIQRTILAGLGFTGLAAVYQAYNLDGYIDVLVGVGMLLAGYYLLKGTDIHIPLDRLLGAKEHHTTAAERVPMHETVGGAKPVPLRLATAHGFIAGWGLGAYASVIVFVLAPQMPNVIFASLVGTFFGIGTMFMQVMLGSLFANIMRLKKLSLDQVKYIGRSAAARTLYLGGLAFAAIGVLVVAFPYLNTIAIGTGNPIPNLDSVGISTILVLFTVGVIGVSSIYLGYREIVNQPANA